MQIIQKQIILLFHDYERCFVFWKYLLVCSVVVRNRTVFSLFILKNKPARGKGRHKAAKSDRVANLPKVCL